MNSHSLRFLRELILVIGWGLISLTGSAERVSVETARQVAMNVVKNFIPGTRSIPSLDLVYTAVPLEAATKNAGDADFFVFNLADRGGFVIVSGEDRVHPVLGYSMKNHFKSEGMPANVRGWLEGYQQQIAQAVQQNVQASPAIQAEWSDYLKGVNQPYAEGGVLLSTAQWGQYKPFNRECQVVPDQDNIPCGCVATALSILMKYNQWPYLAKGGVSSYMGKAVTYNLYQWDQLPMSYKNSYTEAQGQAVADLIWNIGANIKMEYAVEGSGASSSDAVSALRSVFDYSKRTVYRERKYYTSQEWSDMLHQELDAGRPLYYTGATDRKEAHAFVCEGYQGDSYAFNWGWEGQNNGFYLLSSMDATKDGHGFVDYQDCILLHKPEQGEDYIRELSATCDIQSERVKVGTPFTASFGLHNSGSTTLNAYISVAIVDETDYKVKELVIDNLEGNCNSLTFKEGTGYFEDSRLDMPIKLQKELGDKECLMLVYQLEGDNEWKPLCSRKFKDRIGIYGPYHEGETPVQTFDVVYDLENMTVVGPQKTVEKGKDVETFLLPNKSYTLPSTVKVWMGGKELSKNLYSYNSQLGLVKVPNVTGDVLIKASGVYKETYGTCFIFAELVHISITDMPVTVQSGKTVQGKLVPHAGYALPEKIKVKMGNNVLAESYYTYDKSSGSLTIPRVTENIVIYAIGVVAPVANEKITQEEGKFRVEGNRIHIHTLKRMDVSVFDLMGHLVYGNKVEGETSICLPGGCYILAIDRKNYKIMLR